MADHDESGHDSHLHTWCRDGKYKEVEEYIKTTVDHQELEAKLVSRRGVYGYTPLHEAVSKGHHKMLDTLIEHGADVNCRANSKCVNIINIRHDCVKSNALKVYASPSGSVTRGCGLCASAAEPKRGYLCTRWIRKDPYPYSWINWETDCRESSEKRRYIDLTCSSVLKRTHNTHTTINIDLATILYISIQKVLHNRRHLYREKLHF